MPSSARILTVTLMLLRVIAALVLFQAGATKLFGWYGGIDGHGGTVPIGSQLGVGAVLEVVCGAVLMVGFFTRPVSFLMSGQMAVAYFQFHVPHGFWPAQNHGQAAVLLCFVFLFLAANGVGEYSLDAVIAKRNRPEEAKTA